jgi:transposase
MNSIGVDLHKKIITVCVMDEALCVLARKTLYCDQPTEITAFFRQFCPFRVVVEATASYQWFVELVEPLADAIQLANPKKLRVIAESTKKTDRLDAQVLAEFLARDMIPQSYLPTPRQRQHRALVRQRQHIRSRMTAVRNKLRRILSDYNADRRDLFSSAHRRQYTMSLALSDADRFIVDQLWDDFEHYEKQLRDLWNTLKQFAKKATHREKEAREVLKTVPGVGPVTIEVVLSEVGDFGRFRNAKAITAYAGLAPVVRQSGGKKAKDLGISKEGSGLLRWALVEASWRTIRTSPKWERIYERIKKRAGAKRAIVAVARKLLCVIYAMLRTMTPYRILAA